MQALMIGEVAKRAGVGIDTVRFYEREGLIDEPPRRPSGYRQYPPDTVQRVRFIRRAKELGFTLPEIQELISLRDGGAGRRRKDVLILAQAKMRDIDQRLAKLQAMRSALYGLIETCACGQGRPTCPILEALDEPADKLTDEEGPTHGAH